MTTQPPYFALVGDLLDPWYVLGEFNGGVVSALPGFFDAETAGAVTSADVNPATRPAGASRLLGGDFVPDGWTVLTEANAGKLSALPGVMMVAEVGPPPVAGRSRSRLYMGG